MKFFKIKAHAKINFSLNIIGKFSSGLHKIESLVGFLRLHDTIYIRPIKSIKHKVSFKGKFSKNINNSNTVIKLLRILDQKKLLSNKKFEVKVIKNIPQKSGMGGGSMNAASLINFFVKKKLIKLSKKKIAKLSKLIGSDVLLGINPQNSVLISNEKIKKSSKKIGFYSLVTKPDFGCSTKLIYSYVRKYSKPQYTSLKMRFLSRSNIIKSNNALEQIVLQKYPKLKNLKLFLSKLPNVVFVRMTGSGSSIVAYFYSKKALDIAARKFRKKFNNYWFISSKTI